jgi:hypothetical protein
MNTAEFIASLIAGKLVDLAAIAAGYGAFRLIAGRVQVAAPKAPVQPKGEKEPKADPKAEPAAVVPPVSSVPAAGNGTGGGE